MPTASQPRDPAACTLRADLIVVVPALNESLRIQDCLGSLLQQGARLRVIVSDNASTDGTAHKALAFADRFDLHIRNSARLAAAEHFVSAGRFALSDRRLDGDAFAFLAGDDRWSDEFANAALDALAENPEADVVWPTFVWEGEGVPERRLPPPARLNHTWAVCRRLQALVLSDHREVANLIYGVYRREAFEHMLAAWERGGEDFAADYAAAWSVIGHYRVVACHSAVGFRHIRSGADLLQRVGVRRSENANLISLMRTYLTVNVRVNHRLGLALGRLGDDNWHPTPLQLQALRAPQWLWGAVRQFRQWRKRPSARSNQ